MNCPRCSGFVVIEGRDYEEREHCLNCGYYRFTRPVQEPAYVMDALAFAQARRTP